MKLVEENTGENLVTLDKAQIYTGHKDHKL